jgi:hypothetical protein
VVVAMLRGAYLAGFGLAVAMGLADVAQADPRLDEAVYDPYVEKGVLELEARSAGLSGAPGGAAAQANVFELEYGLTNRVSLALVGIESQAPHGMARWSDVGVEGIWNVGQIPSIGVDTALYLEYGHGLSGEPDKLEGKILLAKRAGRLEGLLNLIFERPLNAPDGGSYASYGYAASATWRAVGALRLGAEALGDFGDDHRFGGRQGAYVGPQVKWEFRPFGGKDADGDDDGDGAPVHKGPPIEIDVDAGWLAAVGADRNEATSQVRIAVDLERKF